MGRHTKAEYGVTCIELLPGEPVQVFPRRLPRLPPDNFVCRNTYCYKLVDGKMRLRGIELGTGWENWPAAPGSTFSCYKRGEKSMAKYNWDKLWPQVQALQAQGKSVTDIATELGIERQVLTSKIYRKKNKQTPTPAPDELGGTDPEREEREPAGDSVLDNNEQRQTEDDKAIVAHMRYAFSELFGVPDDGDFTAADEEPMPYTPVENPFDLNRFKIAVLEIFREVAATNQAPDYVTLAFINAIIDVYPEVG